MTYLSKTLILVAGLALAACTNPDRFEDQAGGGLSGGAGLAGSASDPTSPAYFQQAIGESQGAWREVLATAARLGVPTPAFAAALAYYDGYRSARLPANLLQAQRDYFGAHTYKRTDRDGTFHTDWLSLRKQPEE